MSAALAVWDVVLFLVIAPAIACLILLGAEGAAVALRRWLSRHTR